MPDPHARLASLLTEIRLAPSAEDAARAFDSLRLREEGHGEAVVTQGVGESFFESTRSFDVVRIEDDVFGRLPSANARARVLEHASAIAVSVEIQTPILYEASRPARVLVDVPRRILRRFGADVPEPGDRFRGGFRHHYFDEEPLLREIAAAGCVVAGRRGFTFVVRRAPTLEHETPSPFASEIARVLRVVREVERRRLGEAPERAVDAMRTKGLAERARGPIGRARLRGAIGWVDALHPGGANCYRRTLAELALDAGAAREPIVFGLDVGSTGHVSFKDREEGSFDVAFELGAASEASEASEIGEGA